MEAYNITVRQVLAAHHITTKNWQRPTAFARPCDGLVLLTAGSICYHFKTGSQTAVAGDVLCFPKGLVYSGEKQTPTNAFYVVDFTTAKDAPFYQLQLPPVYRPRSGAEILSRFKSLTALWQKNAPYAKLTQKAELYSLLSALAADYAQNQQETKTGREAKNNRLFQEITAYIHQNFTNPNLNVAALGRQFYLSDSSLRRLFYENCNCSPLQSILQLRIQTAETLLREGELPVFEVAQRCGFSSCSYFNRLFKKTTGQTPAHYQ